MDDCDECAANSVRSLSLRSVAERGEGWGEGQEAPHPFRSAGRGEEPSPRFAGRGRERRSCAAFRDGTEQGDAMTISNETHRWPAEGLPRVPYWVYSDRAVYEEEQERIFRGPTWNFLCLEAELANPNSYHRSSLGEMPVVVTRDKDGNLHAFENRCAHRGSLLLLNESGQARDIVCVYHNWSYDLCGNLTGVAF